MTDKPKPNYAPCYAAMYPELATIARKHGYALAVHGSLRRDFDLIAIPWTKEASEPLAVIDEITSAFSVHLLDRKPTSKEHGRLAWTISVGWGECAIDLSFMPRTADNNAVVGRECPQCHGRDWRDCDCSIVEV